MCVVQSTARKSSFVSHFFVDAEHSYTCDAMHCAQWLFVAAVLLHEMALRASARPFSYSGSSGECMHALTTDAHVCFAEEETSDPIEKEILLELLEASEAAQDEVIS